MLNECTHPTIVRNRCTICHEVIRVVDKHPAHEPRCVICLDGTEDLQPATDGKLECRPCREEHPRAGRFSFDQARLTGRVSRSEAHSTGWSRGGRPTRR